MLNVCVILILVSSGVVGLDNGLGIRPPLGFNTWERYRCTVNCNDYPNDCISERLIKKIADILSVEFLPHGYEYLVVDDCWLANTRDRFGNLQPNRTRFPSGIGALVQYVHSKRLKFGIYGNFGEKTCAGYPGIKDDLRRDAEQFAAWKVDFVKLDGCFSDAKEKALGYPEFGKYMNLSGQPMVYSCSWPAYLHDDAMFTNYSLLVRTCNLWRNYDDIEDSWKSVTSIMEWFAKYGDYLARYHGPGHWHDPDMLVIGNFGLSIDQAMSHMAVWCLLGAPLFLSTDLTRLRPEFKTILTNPIALSIDQDELGTLGRRISTKNGIHIWKKPILPIYHSYHSYGIAFVNMRIDGVPKVVRRTMDQLGLYNPGGYEAEDVFCGKVAKFCRESTITVKVNPSGVSFWKFVIIP